MKTSSPKLLLLIAFAMMVTLGGCAAPVAPPDPTLFAVLDSAPAQRPFSGSTFGVSSEVPIVFDIIAGDGAGGSVTFKREATDRFHAEWADDEDGVRTEFRRRADNGDIVLTAAIDRDDSAISLFRPPLIAAYATLAPGQQRTQEVEIRVLDLNNPRQQRESGTATQSMEYKGQVTLQTGSGEFITDCVVIHFEANLRMAKAVQTSTYYLVEDLGIIAAVQEESISALGLFNRTSNRTLLRSDLHTLIDKIAAHGR